MTQVVERKCVPDDLLPDSKLLETAQIFANEVIALPRVFGVALAQDGSLRRNAHVYVFHICLCSAERAELLDEVDDIFAANCFDSNGKIFRASLARLTLSRNSGQIRMPEFDGKKVTILATKK